MNRLAQETSPYLLQHAHNPVDWYPWGVEAFEKAEKENKPILVSIGYSTCHWCHVMERESFENEDTAALMNEYFVCIKVDREERPDVDQIYMEAVQILNGNGGWPLNCFLLPDRRPFFGGTYYPPVPSYQRPSWNQVLINISRAFREQPETVVGQAEKLMAHMQKNAGGFIQNNIEGTSRENIFGYELSAQIFDHLKSRFDQQYGGFGGAPKFPATMSIQFLLAFHHLNGNPDALHHALLSLDKMSEGGIYDQIGGGFSRYATDSAWLVPHFEKMLYDNALLVTVLSEAYSLTGAARFRETIIETLEWVNREMTSEEGGFYSAMDADSEGVEGKFYVWDYAEIRANIQNGWEEFVQYFGVSEEGNWEETNILHKAMPGMTVDRALLKQNMNRLFNIRAKRVHPSLDDKILLSWNALMCTAYCRAYLSLQVDDYKKFAQKNIDFLLQRFTVWGAEMNHTYRAGVCRYHANLEDYAFVIEALINVYQIVFDHRYLQKAAALTKYVFDHFHDKENGMFFFSAENQKDLVLRQKEVYDAAVPSANSTMALNLLKLSHLLENSEYEEVATNMLLSVKDAAGRFPTSFSKWTLAMLWVGSGIREIVITGKNAAEKAIRLQQNFLGPCVVLAATREGIENPHFKGKMFEEDANIYICVNQSCKAPVKTVEEAWSVLQ